MPKQSQLGNLNGFLLINKEPDWTSFDIVKKTQNILREKAGHSGTLDPFAEGLMILAIGKATRFLEYIVSQDKEYIFDLKWGEETDTLDLTGEITEKSDKIPTDQEIQAGIKKFTGKIKQIPPKYSAIKINGKKAYQYAREGNDIEVPEREVTIHKLELLGTKDGVSQFKTFCSKGTYVRSLGSDLASFLGSKGHLTSLKRTKIDRFQLKDAKKISEIKNDSSLKLIEIDEMLGFLKELNVEQEEFERLRKGEKILIKDLPFTKQDIIRLKFNKILFAIAKYEDRMLRPKKVIL